MTKRLDTSAHKRLMAARMEDAEFRAEYEQSRREIALIDSVIHQLDDLREQAGLSKADLARMVGRNPSSIRRLFTQQSNPELALVAALTAALGGELKVVAPKQSAKKKRERELALAGV
jgi:ribosome-binding protein aMBF1 (putative translation factor)